MNEAIFIDMAKAQFVAGKIQDALTILTSALKEYPKSSQLYLERGRIYNAIGNKEAALYDLEKATEINPEIISTINYTMTKE